jgi:ParB family chromosome partitioning protein
LVGGLVDEPETTEPGKPGEPPTPGSTVHEQRRSVRTAMIATEALYPNPFQPRRNTDDENIGSLADSIQQSGLLQPVSVRLENSRYEIIAGERRWLAARKLGMTEIPAIVRDASDEEMLELALIENIQREDLNAIDRARAYRRFCDEFAVRPEEVAQQLGEDRTTVVNYLRLLDLPSDIQGMVQQGKISMGHARCLLGLENAEQMHRLAEAVVANELSVRALEEIVRRKKGPRGTVREAQAREPSGPPPHIRDLERHFEEALKTKVAIHEGRRKGSGRIVIEYYTLDDFDRIASSLGVRLE